MSDSECSRDCPLCMEPFELDDMNFFPCHCKYQICRFCWHRIKSGDSALCPACRQPYPEDPVKFKPMTEDDLQTMKIKKKEKELQRRKRITDNRKHLSQIRVLQKNLVFVVGLPLYLDEGEKLKSVEYFGQYGKVVKVVANNSSAYAGTQAPSLSAYVTYSKMEEALQAVQGVNDVQIDGRTLKASLGTTKYCSTYLKNQQCHKTDCMYLHELADPEASFTKEDMQAQKHQDYERKLMRQMIQRNEESAELAKNNEVKSEETRCSSAPTVKSMLMTSLSSAAAMNKGGEGGGGGDSSVASSVELQAWSGGVGETGGGGGTPTMQQLIHTGGHDMKDPFDDSLLHYDEQQPAAAADSEVFTTTTTTTPPSGEQLGGFPVVKSSSFTDSLGFGAVTSSSSAAASPSAAVNMSSADDDVGKELRHHPFLCDPTVNYYKAAAPQQQQQQRTHKSPGVVGEEYTGRSLHHNTHPLGISRGIPQQSLGGGGVLDEQRNDRIDRLDRLDYLSTQHQSPFSNTSSTTTSNRNKDFSNEILFDSFDTTVNPSSLYGSSLVRNAAPGSESRCLPDARPATIGPIGSGVGVTSTLDPLISVWPSSLSRSSHDFIGSGRNKQQQYNGWPNNCSNKSPFFTHTTTPRNDLIGQQTQPNKDEDDLDFDVFAEGNKEFADIKSTVDHLSFDSSRGFGPGLLGFSDLSQQQQQTVPHQNNNDLHHNKHFHPQLHPLHNTSSFTAPGGQAALGGHLADRYSSIHTSQFTQQQETSEDRRNSFKRLLPPSVKVKFTATETTTSQEPRSRFASYMSPHQPAEPSTLYSNNLGGGGGGWQLPLQMMSLNDHHSVAPRTTGLGNFKPNPPSQAPPPGLMATPYDPAIIASGSTHPMIRHQQQQQQPSTTDSLYSMMESEPHWMKSLHKLTDTNDHGGSGLPSSSSGSSPPLLVNNMNNNNMHMQQQQHQWMPSPQNKTPAPAADPFITGGANPPPGFR